VSHTNANIIGVKFGFDDAMWETAKAEGKALLADYARRRQMIPYSDFVARLRSVDLEPHDFRLRHLLGEISSEEYRAGRGMLTALVVHKTGDYQPGPGFFELAKQLGEDTSDVEKCWVQQVKKVFAIWSGSEGSA
jgi:hypothetical protein